jgi:SAM-dependent methyltransferase
MELAGADRAGLICRQGGGRGTASASAGARNGATLTREHDRTWASKLSDMEQWYRALLTDPDQARRSLIGEYTPHAGYLSKLRGRVLDVGGGAGPTGRYLHPNCRYVVLDPSPLWKGDEWSSFGREFRGDLLSIENVEGVGEAIPFLNDTFDAIVSMWALNHAQDPSLCVREMARVAKPGASVLIVLEDMEPSWLDIRSVIGQKIGLKLGLKGEQTFFHNEKVGYGIKTIVAKKLRGEVWPVQDDHVPVDEAALVSTAQSGLTLIRREWRGGFLTFDFRKRCSPARRPASRGR